MQPRTSRLAILSLVLGCVSGIGFASIFFIPLYFGLIICLLAVPSGVIVSSIAIMRCKKHEELTGMKYAVAGLILSLLPALLWLLFLIYVLFFWTW